MEDLELRKQNYIERIDKILVDKEHINFIDFSGVFKNNKSKVQLYCTSHSNGYEITIDSLLARGTKGCNKCRYEYLNKIYRKNEDEILSEIESLGKIKNFYFVKWLDGYENSKSIMVLCCPIHGEWSSTSCQNLIRKRSGCPKCAESEKGFEKRDNLLPYKYNRNGFLDNKKIWRSKEKAKDNTYSIWSFTCEKCSNDKYVKSNLCSGIFKISTPNLSSRQLPCRCSKGYRWTREQIEFRIKEEMEFKDTGLSFIDFIGEFTNVDHTKFIFICPIHGKQQCGINNFLKGKNGCPECKGRTQKEAYINEVYSDSKLICLKFGIATNSGARLKNQNMKNTSFMKQKYVYLFDEVIDCKTAEKECKNRLKCGVISKVKLKDGSTETVELSELENIIKIYEEFGGKLKIDKEKN